MALSFEIQNQQVQQWAADTDRGMQQTGTSFGITHRQRSSSPSASLPKVKGRLVMADGSVTAVKFSVPRHLFYVHHGAGSGQGGKKGSRWTTAAGISKRTNPESLGKAGTGNRTEKPFIKNTLDRQVPVLADIVASTGAAIVTSAIKFN